jgi:hypothetical protein
MILHEHVLSSKYHIDICWMQILENVMKFSFTNLLLPKAYNALAESF